MSEHIEARARRRDDITRLLARYPHLESADRAELAAWFAREASSHDIAMLSLNDAVADQYRAYRAEHIDRLAPRDWARGLAVAALFVGLLVAVLWRAF